MLTLKCIRNCYYVTVKWSVLHHEHFQLSIAAFTQVKYRSTQPNAACACRPSLKLTTETVLIYQHWGEKVKHLICKISKKQFTPTRKNVYILLTYTLFCSFVLKLGIWGSDYTPLCMSDSQVTISVPELMCFPRNPLHIASWQENPECRFTRCVVTVRASSFRNRPPRQLRHADSVSARRS